MQAAIIDRVLRSFRPAQFAAEAQAEAPRDQATTLANRLLETYKIQLAHRAAQH